MAEKKKVIYSEPAGYFPKEILEQLKEDVKKNRKAAEEENKKRNKKS